MLLYKKKKTWISSIQTSRAQIVWKGGTTVLLVTGNFQFLFCLHSWLESHARLMKVQCWYKDTTSKVFREQAKRKKKYRHTIAYSLFKDIVGSKTIHKHREVFFLIILISSSHTLLPLHLIQYFRRRLTGVFLPSAFSNRNPPAKQKHTCNNHKI